MTTVLTVPVETVTASDTAVGGPRLSGAKIGQNRAHQTGYGTVVVHAVLQGLGP